MSGSEGVPLTALLARPSTPYSSYNASQSRIAASLLRDGYCVITLDDAGEVAARLDEARQQLVTFIAAGAGSCAAVKSIPTRDLLEVYASKDALTPDVGSALQNLALQVRDMRRQLLLTSHTLAD